MNNFFRDLQNEARKLRLSSAEKQAMRIKLYQLMEAAPAPAETVSVKRAPAARIASPYYSWFSVRYMVPLAVLLIIVMGSGTAYAAQGALPGSPLYGVKLNVDEQVQVALATTPEAKATVNADIAQTRLQEAEQLAAQGQLDATTTQELAQNFDQHATAAQTIADNLQTQDPAAAAQISTTLDSSLEAHDAILTQLSATASSSASASSTDVLAAAVEAQESDTSADAGNAVTLAMATPATATPTSSPAQQARTFALARPSGQPGTSSPATTTEGSPIDAALAAKFQQNASSTLMQAQSDYAAIQSSLDATTSAQIQNVFDDISARMSAGATAFASGDSSFAAANFEEALRLGVRLDAFLKAGSFDKSLLPSLLQNIDGPGKGKGNGKGSDATTTPIVPIPVSVPMIQTSASSTPSSSSASVQTEVNVNDNEGDTGSGASQSDINISTSTESSSGNSSASASVQIHASDSSSIQVSY